MSWTPPTIETKRLILRAVTEDDAASIFNYASDSDVSKTATWPTHKTIDDTFLFIKSNVIKNYKNRVPAPFAVTLKSDPSKVIGTVGCFKPGSQNHIMELGYVLGKPFWGQGIITEAAEAIIKWVFDEYKIERIQARCLAENRGSSKVMEKLGMRYEGCSRSAIFHLGYYRDIHWYGLLKNDIR